MLTSIRMRLIEIKVMPFILSCSSTKDATSNRRARLLVSSQTAQFSSSYRRHPGARYVPRVTNYRRLSSGPTSKYRTFLPAAASGLRRGRGDASGQAAQRQRLQPDPSGGPRKVAKNNPSPPKNAVLILPTYWRFVINFVHRWHRRDSLYFWIYRRRHAKAWTPSAGRSANCGFNLCPGRRLHGLSAQISSSKTS